jgi:hypothetical protein
MPQIHKGPRLALRPARRDDRGRITHKSVWVIRDGEHRRSTRCGRDDRERAEQALAEYIAYKRIAASASKGDRHPSQIAVADVLALYLRDIAPKHARPQETAQRAKALLAFFGDKTLVAITGGQCRADAGQRSTVSAARRELEDLRAAINHHRREGLCSQVVEVALPPEGPARERWLTRSEAARLILISMRPIIPAHPWTPDDFFS